MSFLSQKWQRILLALSHILVPLPVELDQKQIEKRFLQRTNDILKVTPPIQRWFLHFVSLVFDCLPFFFGFGPNVFTDLKPIQQQQYFDKWLFNRFVILRDSAKAIRGLVLVVYFSDQDIWKYIDFDPWTHVRERTELRNKILSEKSS